MVDLTIPDIDDAVVKRLEIRAMLHGRTLNEEVCQILTDYVREAARTDGTEPARKKPDLPL